MARLGQHKRIHALTALLSFRQETSRIDEDVRLSADRTKLVRSLRANVADERVLEAFAAVPREWFVPADLRRFAYQDRPLPIGHDQTISQPLMVALMIEAMRLGGDEKVLEVGTGSGYQAALLSRLAREVISVERIEALAQAASRRLGELGYDNVRVLVARDELGWPEEAPYDAIVVAAGAPHPPQTLLDQLELDGRLVVPVGSRKMQQLVRATKSAYGVTLERLGECRFVPLIGGQEGWPDVEAWENGRRSAL
jgi:protein-L-isoaspartate(D-aspartate) O-methyltransferase